MKFFISFILFIGFSLGAISQVPNGFNYQAVVRDATGELIVNDVVQIRFSMRQSTANGIIIFQETHSIATNEYGIVNLIIGQGSVNSGIFSEIDWSGNLYFLQVEFNIDGDFVDVGTQQIWSVPYSLNAQNAENARNAWTITGNAGMLDSVNFVGTTDNIPLNFRINNDPAGKIDPILENTFLGQLAGSSNSTGNGNTALGFSALLNNESGSGNTAIGYEALLNNVIGSYETAVGYQAMKYRVPGWVNGFVHRDNVAVGNSALKGSFDIPSNTGSWNTAVGSYALENTSSGGYNTAIGRSSMFANSTGYYNSAFGVYSLNQNTTGNSNSAVGHEALYYNQSGSDNTALGSAALKNNEGGDGGVAIGYESQKNVNDLNSSWTNTNTSVGYGSLRGSEIIAENSGLDNTAVGYLALVANSNGNANSAFGLESLYANDSGNHNTGDGFEALHSNISGSYNTAIGSGALDISETASNNVAIGYDAGGNQTTGENCTFIGYSAEGSSGSFINSMALGYQSLVSASNRVRIGNNSITQIGGQVGWSSLSDVRLKKNIVPSKLGLNFILKLKPVKYNFIEGHEGILYTGFIAQEVEKSLIELGEEFSGITKPENETDYYSIRYSEFVVPLVTAVQQQQEMIEDLQAENLNLKAILIELQRQVDALIVSTSSK